MKVFNAMKGEPVPTPDLAQKTLRERQRRHTLSLYDLPERSLEFRQALFDSIERAILPLLSTR